MLETIKETVNEDEAAELATSALGMRPLRIVRQSLSDSQNTVYRLDLPEGSVVLRISPRKGAFAYTQRNLDVFRALGLPVQSVLAAGSVPAGGSYIFLSWIPGRDLAFELAAMSPAQMTMLAELVVECQRRVTRLPRSEGFGWAPLGKCGPLQRWTDVFGEAAPASLFDDGTRLGALRRRLAVVRNRVESYFGGVPATAFLDDLTIKNVLIANGGLSGLIDVDFVCYGDPLMSVGATIAFIARDVGAAGRFYGEELIRCWNPSADVRQAIAFYASLWTVGFLSAAASAKQSICAEVLAETADAMLSSAEAA